MPLKQPNEVLGVAGTCGGPPTPKCAWPTLSPRVSPELFCYSSDPAHCSNGVFREFKDVYIGGFGMFRG